MLGQQLDTPVSSSAHLIPHDSLTGRYLTIILNTLLVKSREVYFIFKESNQ